MTDAMDKDMFDLWAEAILAPTLRSGEVVILDKLQPGQQVRATKA